MTPQNPLTIEALLLRNIGEVLFGPSWQDKLCDIASVSDRSMRRWASGADPIPPGVWRDIHYEVHSRWRTLKHFDDEMVKLLEQSRLQPIPNTRPLPDTWGLYFVLATPAGRPVRCFIRREVLDDRVHFNPMKRVFDYFTEHAPAFYKIAQRKYDIGEIENGLITINEADINPQDDHLPDVRGVSR